MNALTIGYILFTVVAAAAALLWITRFIHKKYFLETLKLRTLLIRLTQKPAKEEERDPLKEINLTGQLLSGLANSKIPFSLEAAVNHIGKEINFYVSVPVSLVDFAMRQIQGLWADAYIEEVDDYNIFNHQGINQGIYLKQKEISALPVRTFEEANLDTFLPILNSLSKIQEVGEGAAIQLLIKPAPKKFKKTLADYIYRLKKGAKLSDLMGAMGMISLKDFKKALESKDKNKEKEKEQVVIDEEVVKAFEKKMAKQIFSVVARIAVSAPNQSRADEILQTLAGSFDQFQVPARNGLKAMRPRNQKEFLFNYIFRIFNEKEQMILGTDELISLFHLPTSMTEIPHIGWLKSRESAPPINLPKSGTLIGESSFRGERLPVFITDEDRRRHVYIIGQTGTGKTTIMRSMILEDIKAGRGVAIIDPHGEFADYIAGVIPAERKDDVVIFDPGDLSHPLGLNMLEYDFNKPEQKTFIVNEVQSIFNKLFSQETMGPMFEQYMRNALLLLMEDARNEPTTLMDVSKVFTDDAFRKGKLARCQNPVVKDFWEREALMAGGEASLQNITPYITSKFGNFTSNDYVRPIISQSKSSLRFREIMDNKKILLANLSKGRIGDINANLLGMIIVGKLLMAALSREDVPQEKRPDFNLYIDEFQNFTTDSIAVILSEARKYRLNLVIAHQFIAQLEEKIRDAVFGNVGSIIAFRIGADDAEKIIKQFEPVFTENDLISIDNLNAYAKILINGQTTKPFNIKITFPPKSDETLAGQIKELSWQKYGSRDRG